MAHIIHRLQGDHRNITRILDLLEKQLALFRQDRIPDFALMGDAMHYIVHYHDLFHHPGEDIVLQRLEERETAALELAEELRSQHSDLARSGKAFLKALQGAESEGMVSRDALEASASGYIGALRAHIRKEEDEFFPLALRALGAADWEAVHAALTFAEDDPVFGAQIAARYQALYDYLAQSR